MTSKMRRELILAALAAGGVSLMPSFASVRSSVARSMISVASTRRGL